MAKNKNNKSQQSTKDASEKFDQLGQQAEKERGRKPGSQSNSSDRHNTGRGGGK
jgi:hypothetical protein